MGFERVKEYLCIRKRLSPDHQECVCIQLGGERAGPDSVDAGFGARCVLSLFSQLLSGNFKTHIIISSKFRAETVLSLCFESQTINYFRLRRAKTINLTELKLGRIFRQVSEMQWACFGNRFWEPTLSSECRRGQITC